jgi:hypothetical protein
VVIPSRPCALVREGDHSGEVLVARTGRIRIITHSIDAEHLGGVVFQTLYQSRRLELSPLEASLAFDRWRHKLASNTKVSGQCVAGTSLRLSNQARFGADDQWTLRGVRGSIRTFGRTVPIELELSVWSANSCELGFRPLDNGWPVRTSRYLRSAFRALGEVRNQILEDTGVNVVPMSSTVASCKADCVSPR